MSKKLLNPFNQNDYLTEVLTSDINYTTSKNQAFKVFLKEYQSKDLLVSEPKKSFFGSFFKTITTHSTAFILGLIITTGAIGASAAENYAPKNYKPSMIFNELFKINKQTEKNPYTKLTADANNNVVVSERCGVAIKYPKQIGGEGIAVRLQQADKFNPTIIESIVFDATRQFSSAINDSTIPINNLGFTCRSEEFYSNDDPKSNWILVNKDILRKYTGWFIAIENDITEFKMAKTQVGEQFQTFRFKFKDKFYEMDFHTKENLKNPLSEDEGSNFYLKNKGLFGEQIQIQFNSLVRSDSNVILDYQASSSSVSSIASSSLNSSALEIIKSVNQGLNQSLGFQTSSQNLILDKWSNKTIYPLMNVPLAGGWKVLSDQANNQGTNLVLIKANIKVQLDLTPKTPTGGFGYQCYTDAKKVSQKLFRARDVLDISSINTNQNFIYYPISQFSFEKGVIETNLKSNEEVFSQKYNSDLRSKIDVCGSSFETATTLMSTSLNGSDGQARIRITVNGEASEANLLEVDSLINQITGITVGS